MKRKRKNIMKALQQKLDVKINLDKEQDTVWVEIKSPKEPMDMPVMEALIGRKLSEENLPISWMRCLAHSLCHFGMKSYSNGKRCVKTSCEYSYKWNGGKGSKLTIGYHISGIDYDNAFIMDALDNGDVHDEYKHPYVGN